jgi:lipid-A-disaccharide synthase-like uncharacterized protein
MLFTLYYFKTYLIPIVTVLICCQSVFAMSLMSQHFLLKPKAEENQPYLFYSFYVISAVVVVIYYFTKNWILNNVLGLCLALTFLKTL